VISRAVTAAHWAYVRKMFTAKQAEVSPAVRMLGRLGRRSPVKTSLFLHIPKTGGTAVKGALRSVSPEQAATLGIRSIPLLLGHRASYTAFRDPNLDGCAFSFVFRDPTQRYVSGFYEALRQGRPHKAVSQKPWNAGYLAAFVWFKDANDLFEALGSHSERTVSAAVSALHHILDLRWDHVWMLGTAEEFGRRKNNIRHYCPIEQLGTDFPLLLDLGDSADLPGIRALLNQARVAPAPPPPLSDIAVANLRVFRADEYRLHEYLLENYRPMG